MTREHHPVFVIAGPTTSELLGDVERTVLMTCRFLGGGTHVGSIVQYCFHDHCCVYDPERFSKVYLFFCTFPWLRLEKLQLVGFLANKY